MSISGRRTNMTAKYVLGATIASLAIVASASAMEMTASTSMMMKDDAMMKKDTMMKKDDGAMMMKKEEAMKAREIEITALQDLLIEKGYLVLPEGAKKGTFGPRTRAALRNLQKENGLPSTGFFGAMTKAKIANKESVMMMKKDAMMMKKEAAMMKKDDAMMMKKDGAMMKGTSTDAMTHN